MRIYHITPRYNVASILKRGLLREFCCDLFDKYVALCGPGFLSHWTEYLGHLYGLRHDELYTLTVEIPFEREITFCSKAYYCFEDIPPSCIRGQPLLTRLFPDRCKSGGKKRP